jgi:hypothetical protein
MRFAHVKRAAVPHHADLDVTRFREPLHQTHSSCTAVVLDDHESFILSAGAALVN